MIKHFESFDQNIPIIRGDRVAVSYKDSKYFMKTGTVVDVNKGTHKGDCSVQLDYGNVIIPFFYTNLEKIIDVVSVPSGESVSILLKDAENLFIEDTIRYNKFMDYYYYDDEDRWQIEEYFI